VPDPSRFKPLASSCTTSRPIKDRLTQALSTLTCAPHRSPQRLTISSLCRLACVSRNTLYRYYPDMAEAVRRSRRRRGAGLQAAQQSTLRSLRSELSMLRGQLAKLATLADHYYAAAEELRALLARRDRELAALRGRLRPTPVRIHR
jgi:hypothetical protein